MKHVGGHCAAIGTKVYKFGLVPECLMQDQVRRRLTKRSTIFPMITYETVGEEVRAVSFSRKVREEWTISWIAVPIRYGGRRASPASGLLPSPMPSGTSMRLEAAHALASLLVYSHPGPLSPTRLIDKVR